MALEDAIELELVTIKRATSTLDIRETSTTVESSTLKHMDVKFVMDTRSRQMLPLTEAITAGIFDEKTGRFKLYTHVKKKR